MLSGAPALCRAAAALVSSERGNGIEPEALPPVKYSSAPELSCSPKNGMMSCMQLSQEDSQGKQVRGLTAQSIRLRVRCAHTSHASLHLLHALNRAALGQSEATKKDFACSQHDNELAQYYSAQALLSGCRRGEAASKQGASPSRSRRST